MRRRAFSLVELLVVIGIITILIGILLPTIVSARRSADDTACAARLHDLLAATTIYFNDYKSYPPLGLMPALNGPMPAALTQEFVNQLGVTLGWPTVDYTMAVRQLPTELLCPVRAGADFQLTAVPPTNFGESFWDCGYQYSAGVMEVGGTTATALLPARITGLRGLTRGVIWSDDLCEITIGGVPRGWAYWHWTGGQPFDPTFNLISTPTSLRGVHSGWSDGSVEWNTKGMLNLDPTQTNTAATYRVGPVGTEELFFYF